MSMSLDAVSRGIRGLKRSLFGFVIQKRGRPSLEESPNFLLKTIDVAKVFSSGLLVVVSIKIVISTIIGDFTFSSSAYQKGSLALTKEAQSSIDSFYWLHDIVMGTQLLESISYLRAPILLSLGVILPLVVFIFNWNYRVFARALNPYFLLVGAQAITLLIASRLLGPGAMTFVGIVYSSLRSLQMASLLKWLPTIFPVVTSQGHVKRCPRILLWGARFQWLLWTLNTLYLSLYVVNNVVGLAGLGLEWHWR